MRIQHAQQRAQSGVVVAGAAAKLTNGLFNLVPSPPAPERLGTKKKQLRKVGIQRVSAAGGIPGGVGNRPILLVKVNQLAVADGKLRPRPRKGWVELSGPAEPDTGGLDVRAPAAARSFVTVQAFEVVFVSFRICSGTSHYTRLASTVEMKPEVFGRLRADFVLDREDIALRYIE